MKKLRLLLNVVLLLAVPQALQAYVVGDVITYNNVTYEVTNAVSNTLSATNSTVTGHLAIPATFSIGDVTFTVTEIGGTSTSIWSGITSITLPNTIVTIGIYALRGSRLTTLHIPASVRNIYFFKSSAPVTLQSFTVDAANPNFEAADGILYEKGRRRLIYAPRGKSFGTEYAIPSGVEEIATEAFAHTSITKLTIPASVKNIEYGAFTACTSLANIVVNSGNTYYCIVNDVLFTKDMKTLVHYPASKTDASYKVPDGVTTVYGFNSAKFSNIDLNGTTKIVGLLFTSCPNLTDVTIPPGLTADGLAATFQTAARLQNINVAAGNPRYSSVNGVLFSAAKDTLLRFPRARTGAYSVPVGTKAVGPNAFWGCTGVTSVTTPASMKSIQNAAFENCGKLATVTLNEGLDTIDSHAFWHDNLLTGITIPKTVRYIGRAAFAYCEKLSEETFSIAAPSSLNEVVTYAFQATSFKTFTFPSSLTKLGAVIFTQTEIEEIIFPSNSMLQTIGDGCFLNQTTLKNIDIPASVTYIGASAFRGCSSLKAVNFLPGGPDLEFGEGAFADCGFETISLPERAKTISREAFRNCAMLQTAELGSRVSSVSPEAFKGCYNLQRIVVDKANTTYSSIDGMLLSKDKETLVLFPPGKANDKFTLLAPSIRTIGDYAFYQNERLTNVVIPNRVTSLGRRAFGLCPNLNTLTLLCDNLIDPDNIRQALNEATFDDGNTTETSQFGEIGLHLRKAVYDDYKANHENTGDKYDTFYGQFPNIYSSFHPLSNPSVSTTQRNEAEEYIAVSENEVSLIKANSTTDETYVVPETVSRTRTQPYKVGMIGDYAFSGCSGNIKEVVLPGEVSYIGAMAFLSTEGSTAQSSIRRVFLLNATTDAETFSTTRFELDDTGTDYSEFARNTRVYVKKSTFQDAAFQDAVKRYTTSNTAIGRNATPQMFQYKIMDYGSETGVGIRLSNTYGTFAREFDVDLSEYAKELGENVHVVAFTSPRDADSHFKPGEGDGDNKTGARYYVRMTSLKHTMQDGTEVDGTYVPAGTGVLLKVMTGMRETDEEFYYCIGEDGRAAAPAASYLVGVTRHGTTIDDTGRNIFGMQKGVFQPLNGATNVPFPVHKAYLQLDGFPGATAGNSAGAKLMFLMGGEVVDPADDTVTSIDGLDEGTGRKDESPVYDLQGRRLSANAALKSGIYVKNGKKFVIK